ncbi:MAG: hypothetical protein ACHQ50_17820, partial [Fimbriimonadales bacterium]
GEPLAQRKPAPPVRVMLSQVLAQSSVSQASRATNTAHRTTQRTVPAQNRLSVPVWLVSPELA